MINPYIYPLLDQTKIVLNFTTIPPRDVVVEKVCQAYEIKPNNVFVKTRKRNIVDARQMISYFLRVSNQMTFQSIADLFNQDHASVIHACKTITERVYVKDKKTIEKLNYVKKELNYYLQSVSDRNHNG